MTLCRFPESETAIWNIFLQQFITRFYEHTICLHLFAKKFLEITPTAY